MSYLDINGLRVFWTKIKSWVTNQGYGTYSKPQQGIPKTDLENSVQTSLSKADSALQTAPVTSVNSKTGAVALTASDVGLGNVGNFKAVSTQSNQGLTVTEKENARTNIGAGTSSFSGNYTDLSNKPTIPTKVSQLTNDSGYTTNTGTITGITMNGDVKGTSGVVNLGVVLTEHQDISNYAKVSDLTSHTNNTSNPHKVTAAQVGADPSGSASSALTSAKAYTDDAVAAVPKVTTGTSADGSTTLTVTNKDGSTTTALVDGKARADINNLEIGGRNLLLNSELKDNVYGWGTYGITDYVVKDRRKCAHMSFSSFGVSNFVTQSILGKLEPDTQYTMSGWVLTENVVKGTTNFACMVYHDGYYDDNGTNKWYSYGQKDVPLNAGEWTHLEVPFTTDSTKLLNSTASYIYLYARDMTGDIYFCDFKLEKGNKATDWTPAPEDKADVPRLLWTNASPSSAFAAQTLDSSDGIPDLSEYDSIAVVCKVHTSSSQYFEERGPLDGKLAASALYSATSSVYRLIDLSVMSEIYIGAPAGAATDTSYIIPYKIYGIKGV